MARGSLFSPPSRSPWPDSRTKIPTVEQANGEILLWQSRIRLGFALLIASIGTALLASDALPRISSASVGALVAYVCAVFSFVLVRRRDFVPPSVQKTDAKPTVPANPVDI